jgi:hypothetical protein
MEKQETKGGGSI